MLLYLGGKTEVCSVGKEHGGVHDHEGLYDLMVAARAVDDITVSVHGLGNLNAGVDVIAYGVYFICTDTEIYEEVLAADLLDTVADHYGEAGPVLRAAAPLVGAVVHQRGEELVEQPAVAAVEQYHSEAGFLDPESGLSILLDYLVDDFLGHFRNKGTGQAGAGLGAGNLGLAGSPNLMAFNKGLAGEHAGVHQLDGGNCAVFCNGIGHSGQGGDAFVGVQSQVLWDVHTVLGVDISLAYMYNSGTAPGLCLVVSHEGLSSYILPGQVAVAGGSGKDAVSENYFPQLEGTEQIGILDFVHNSCSCLKQPPVSFFDSFRFHFPWMSQI